MTKYIICFCLFIITMAGCSENNESQSISESSNKSINKLIVLNEDGSEGEFKYNSSQVYCYVATWCPYSKKFIDIIKDSTIQANLKNNNFSFLLGDEWPSIERQLDELVAAGEMTEAKAQESLSYLKEKSGYGLLLDPDFVESLPGKVYLIKNTESIDIDSIPSVYSNETDSFIGYVDWISQNTFLEDNQLIGILKNYVE